MKIGIVGAGNVGKSLGGGFAARGHDVVLGSRNPGEKDELPAGTRAASFADAARHGEVVVLSVPWRAIDAVLDAIPLDAVAGKVLADTSNPLTSRDGRPAGLAMPPEGSAAQHVAARFPAARVVKAWNTVGAPFMVDPQFPNGPPDMLICGDDAAAKATIARLCDDLRYPAFDAGDLTMAGELEHLAWIWISIMLSGRTKGHAFKLLRR